MNEILNAIANRSSIRRYTEEPLTEKEVQTLVKAGMQAPTARNAQEVHFSVLPGSHPILAELEAEKRLQFLSGDMPAEMKEQIRNDPNNFYFQAPLVLFLSADNDFSWSKLDAGIAAENIALAAEGLGLGSLIIGSIGAAFSGEKKAYFEKSLAFPENFGFAICVAVGHKGTEKEPHTFDAAKSVSYL